MHDFAKSDIKVSLFFFWAIVKVFLPFAPLVHIYDFFLLQ
jgi:hypothetical protein